MCLVKEVELNHHKMSDQLLHKSLKKEKVVEIRMVIKVAMKKIITDGLQK